MQQNIMSKLIIIIIFDLFSLINYRSLNSNKYLIFKNKMKQLWLKDNVVEAINRAN